MTLLPDPSVVDLYGFLLLMHGDSLCVDDTAYRVPHAVALTRLAASIPARTRAERQAAEQARKESQRHTAAEQNAAIMDVNADAVVNALNRAGVSSHPWAYPPPAIHALDIDGKPAHRIVLSDRFQPVKCFVSVRTTPN
jgi:UDP-2,3-diacylglucosamine pyrophosphatase LpxH